VCDLFRTQLINVFLTQKKPDISPRKETQKQENASCPPASAAHGAACARVGRGVVR